jgi:hypothetical protein
MEAVYEEVHMYSQLFGLPASRTGGRLRKGLVKVDIVSICMYIYVYIYINVYIYIYIHICTCIYIYISLELFN